MQAREPAARTAAAVMIPKTSWIVVFEEATRTDAKPAELSDVIAAVSMVTPSKQASVEFGAHRAVLNLIKRGDETRIAEIVQLFERYGDKQLAEDLLNSGQKDLRGAAERWASAHRLKVQYPFEFGAAPGGGSHRADWGSGR